jgi:hypothetical protein
MADEKITDQAGTADVKTWEDVLAEMDDTAKAAYENHTSGLKSALEKERDSVKAQQANMKALEQKVKDIEAAAGDSEKLKAELAAANAQIAENGTKLAYTEKAYAAKLAAVKSGAYDPDDIIKNIDMDKIAYAGGAIAGIDEQIEAIKKAKPYLFTDSKKAADGGDIDANKGGGTGNLSIDELSKLSMADYKEYRKTHKVN